MISAGIQDAHLPSFQLLGQKRKAWSVRVCVCMVCAASACSLLQCVLLRNATHCSLQPARLPWLAGETNGSVATPMFQSAPFAS